MTIPRRLQVIKKRNPVLKIEHGDIFLTFFEHGSKICYAFRDYFFINGEIRVGFCDFYNGIYNKFIEAFYFIFGKFAAEPINDCGMVEKFFAEVFCYGFVNFIRKAGTDKKTELCFEKFFFVFLKKSGDFFIDNAHSDIGTDRDAIIAGKIRNIFGNFKKVAAVCADICGKKRRTFFCDSGFA